MLRLLRIIFRRTKRTFQNMAIIYVSIVYSVLDECVSVWKTHHTKLCVFSILFTSYWTKYSNSIMHTHTHVHRPHIIVWLNLTSWDPMLNVSLSTFHVEVVVERRYNTVRLQSVCYGCGISIYNVNTLCSHSLSFCIFYIGKCQRIRWRGNHIHHRRYYIVMVKLFHINNIFKHRKLDSMRKVYFHRFLGYRVLGSVFLHLRSFDFHPFHEIVDYLL